MPAARKATPAKATHAPAEPVEPVDDEDEAPEFCPDPATCFPAGIQAGHHHAHCVHGEWHIPTE